jgi:hypothetical protein
METSSLDDLKREVEAAFEEAQDEVRDSLSPLLDQIQAHEPQQEPEAEQVLAAAVATIPARYAAPDVAELAPQQVATQVRQLAPPAPPAPTQATFTEVPPRRVPEQPKRHVPPPPPARRPQSNFEALWEGMEGGKPLDQSDPINAFAPPPRMDWGPQRSERKGRGLRRLRPTNA